MSRKLDMEISMAQQGFKAASRRYHRLYWPLMAIYVAACFAGAAYVDEGTTPVWIAASVAIATAAPLLLVLWLMLRYFDETDEYTRLRQLKAFAEGAAITIGAVLVIGFLQMFEVVQDVAVFWFGPMFFVAYGLAFCLRSLRSGSLG